MTVYYRPIPSLDPARLADARLLTGGPAWFTQAERLERGKPSAVVPLAEVPADLLETFTAPRPPLAGLTLDRPRLMGVLNVTPDSFSDGGQFHGLDSALAQGRALLAGGADILDIGGESTRPGASEVPVSEEIARTAPVIDAFAAELSAPISIDTRKAAVAEAALNVGARIVNDVSALTFDPALAPLLARTEAPLILMHAQGRPETMQDDPRYGDVLLDVYDALAERVAAAEAAGIPRARLVVDPGIGFGKTLDHNLALLSRISLFHGLGCPLLLGASRKRFIGTLGDAPDPADRMPGSVGVALAALRQGVHVLRVHDIVPTKQALTLYRAATGVRDER